MFEDTHPRTGTAGPDPDLPGSYRDLFLAMGEGMAVHEIVCDAAGTPVDYRFLEANPAFERLTGLSREQVVGRTVREVLPGIEPSWIEAYGRVTLTGVPERLEAFAGPLGRLYDVYAYRSAPGRFVTLFQDMTERRRTETALRESEAWFRAVFDQSADGVVIAANDGTVIRLNPAARALFAHTEDVAIGRPFPHPLNVGESREIRVAAPTDDGKVVEMRVATIRLDDREFLCANLRDLTALARLRDDLRNLAMVDELTRVFNRRGFMEVGAKHLLRCRRTREGFWLLFADVDGMKTINDELGHHAGDQALVEFAEVLGATLRQSDVVGRIGGDEFAILLMDVDRSALEAVTRRLERNVAQRNGQPGRTHRLSYSLGAAFFDHREPCSLEELLRQADSRMYEQKRVKQSGFFRRPTVPVLP